MKMTRLFKSIVFAGAAIFAASCAKEPSVTPQPVNMIDVIFDASFEGATKTALNVNKSEWVAGDKIGFLEKSNKAIYASDAASTSGETVSFSVSLPETTEDVMAFYPYDETFTAAGSTFPRIVVTLPEVQKAVKGGFDPSCAFATSAYVKPGKALNFMNAVGMVKVTLNRNDVKSIMIESNNPDVHLTGNKIDINHSGNFALYTSNGSSVFSQKAILKASDDAPLEAGDYYICLIPTPDNLSFNFTLTYTTSDAFYEKTSTKPLVVKRNTITNLGIPSGMTEVKMDNYTKYINGEPLTIAGKTYSIADTPAELLSSEESQKDIRSLIHNVKSDKVYFLDAAENCSFDIASSVAVITSNVAFVSNSDELVHFVPTRQSKLQLGSLGLKNISIDFSKLSDGNLFNNADATADADGFYFENCDFKNMTKPFYSVSSQTTGIKNFVFRNCKFEFKADGINVINVGGSPGTTALDKYKTVEFTKNTFYSGTEGTAYKMRGFTYNFNVARTATETQWDDKVAIFNNNLLYNISSLEIIADYQVGKFEMNNNVVAAPNATSNHTYLILQSKNQSDSAISFKGNEYYSGGSMQWRGTRYIASEGEAGENTLSPAVREIVGTSNQLGIADNPVTGVDIAAGSFTLAERYSNIGAQR